jgi:molecular chaperone HscB
MNYFELFDLPVAVKVDKEQLKRQFFSLSRRYHPDHFAGGSDEEQSEALNRSAELNKAYKTLTNKDETIRYLLQLNGLLAEEDKTQLPQAFLMEMLEVNEELADADLSDPEEKDKVARKLESIRKEIYEPVQDIMESDQKAISQEELLRLKDYYLKKKYLKRLAAQSGQKLL